MPQLSVIVPIYNAEKFLMRCVNSILDQKFKDFELILIDDGSSDASPEICDEIIKNDNRIVVIHQDNAGVAAARNIGIEIATGNYIAFVDSDDFIEEEMYFSMINIAEKYNCDVVMCDCIKEYKSESELYTHKI